jgi:hypothetical protein
MRILKAAGLTMVTLYMASVVVMSYHYSWRSFKDHGIGWWLLTGGVVSVYKAAVWPYFVFVSPQLEEVTEKLEALYFKTHDDWVVRGGPIPEVEKAVVEPCGKLVMLAATTGEKAAFMSTEREEFDFRVDVCPTNDRQPRPSPAYVRQQGDGQHDLRQEPQPALRPPLQT